MKKFVLLIFLSAALSGYSQVGIGTTSVNGSAVLQLNSINKGLIIPRMNSSQRTGITGPATGLLVYDSTVNEFFFYDGNAWVQSMGPAGTTGTNGTDGRTILSGTVNPANGTGNSGDFYINTSSNFIFGPKAGGAWPAGVSMAGPAGPSGVASNNTMGYSNNTGYTIPQGPWIGGPGPTQTLLTTNGALVNVTVSLRAASLPAPVVACNLCYSTNLAAGSWIPITIAGGADELVYVTLSNTAVRTVTLTGKVKPLSAGVYWISPCFKATDDIVFYSEMGYFILL